MADATRSTPFVTCSRIALMTATSGRSEAEHRDPPDRSAAATIACASASEFAMGFSHRTCLPASRRPTAGLSMQVVRDHDAHSIDGRVVGDRSANGLSTLVSVPLGSVDGEGPVRVGDGDEADTAHPFDGDRLRQAVPVGVGAPRHPGPDDSHADAVLHDAVPASFGAVAEVRTSRRDSDPAMTTLSNSQVHEGPLTRSPGCGPVKSAQPRLVR